MSETQHRIIESPLIQSEWLEYTKKMALHVANHVTEYSTDAWYWVTNYVTSAPERKILVLGVALLAILAVLMEIKRTRLV